MKIGEEKIESLTFGESTNFLFEEGNLSKDFFENDFLKNIETIWKEGKGELESFNKYRIIELTELLEKLCYNN